MSGTNLALCCYQSSTATVLFIFMSSGLTAIITKNGGISARVFCRVWSRASTCGPGVRSGGTELAVLRSGIVVLSLGVVIGCHGLCNVLRPFATTRSFPYVPARIGMRENAYLAMLLG
eukprot:882040-Rhodomonas_salina.2